MIFEFLVNFVEIVDQLCVGHVCVMFSDKQIATRLDDSLNLTQHSCLVLKVVDGHVACHQIDSLRLNIHPWLLLVDLNVVYFRLATTEDASDLCERHNISCHCPFNTQYLTNLISDLASSTADVNIRTDLKVFWKDVQQVINPLLCSLLLLASNLFRPCLYFWDFEARLFFYFLQSFSIGICQDEVLCTFLL